MSSVTYEWSMERRWYWQGKTEILREEPIPVPRFPPDFPHGLSWDRIRPPRRETGDRQPEPDLRDQWSTTERLDHGKPCLPVTTTTKRWYSELITFLFRCYKLKFLKRVMSPRSRSVCSRQMLEFTLQNVIQIAWMDCTMMYTVGIHRHVLGYTLCSDSVHRRNM